VEPSGPVQACNGIVLPLPLHVWGLLGHCLGVSTSKKRMYLKVPVTDKRDLYINK